jgi:hypothetical protein
MSERVLRIFALLLPSPREAAGRVDGYRVIDGHRGGGLSSDDGPPPPTPPHHSLRSWGDGRRTANASMRRPA